MAGGVGRINPADGGMSVVIRREVTEGTFVPSVRIHTITKTLGIALLALAAPATVALAQGPRPDLAISSITAGTARLGVGETFSYNVVARNAGKAPCNWVNLTLKLPGELDLVSASSAAPLTCGPDPAVRVVGQPFDVACRGGAGFFLWPGNTITASFTVRALRTASSVRATAVADPGGVCFESNEANNKKASGATAIIQRPSLRMTLNRPFPPTPAKGRSPGSQIFPVTITNVGAGPAVRIALAITTNAPGFIAPTIDIAYKGALAGPDAVPAGLIPPQCSWLPAGPGQQTRLCELRTGLQPGQVMHVHYREVPLCNLVVPLALPDIRVSTSDDITTADHAVVLSQACYL